MERHLYYHEYANVRYDEAVRLLRDEGHRLLHDATEAAGLHAGQHLASLSVDVGGFTISREVEVVIGEPETVGAHATRFAITWHARRGIFPVMRGTIELAEIARRPAVTQVSLLGAYRAPLGALGGAVDAIAGQHVAERTIEALVRGLAHELERVEETQRQPALVD